VLFTFLLNHSAASLHARPISAAQRFIVRRLATIILQWCIDWRYRKMASIKGIGGSKPEVNGRRDWQGG
jgi:hypothetical protein